MKLSPESTSKPYTITANELRFRHGLGGIRQQHGTIGYQRYAIKLRLIDPTTNRHRGLRHLREYQHPRLDDITIQRQLRYRSDRPFVQVSNIGSICLPKLVVSLLHYTTTFHLLSVLDYTTTLLPCRASSEDRLE